MDTTINNVIMVGVGGQGIILASEIMSEVAMEAGYNVKKSEVHGMAQRGGSVSSHVRYGINVKSPLIELGQADYMLAFEKVEGLRSSDFLKPGATIIMNNIEIIPTTVSMGLGEYPNNSEDILKSLGYNLVMVNAQELAKKAGTSKAANVVLLATLASFLDIEPELWEEVIKRRVPKKFHDVNLKAFQLGYEVSRFAKG